MHGVSLLARDWRSCGWRKVDHACCFRCEIRNPKSEIRDKSENSNGQKRQTGIRSRLFISLFPLFEFVSDFDIRISDLSLCGHFLKNVLQRTAAAANGVDCYLAFQQQPRPAGVEVRGIP